MARLPAHRRPYVASGDFEDRLRSAAALARFAVTSSDVIEPHQRDLLKKATWFVTEADGKYATRYRSVAVATLAGPQWWKELRHDHVVTRKVLVAQLRANPADAEAILRGALACTVTKEEHARLTPFDDSHAGWERYAAAGVDVDDLATGRPVVRAGQVLA